MQKFYMEYIYTMIDNNLAYTRPDIALEWDEIKNGNLKPSDVKAGSERKVWWKCKAGHNYQAKIYNRTAKRGTGCPYCSGRKTIKGKNDLPTLRPDLAKEWDFEKNKGILLSEASIGSDKKVWWKCPKGHGYQAMILNRTRKGSGCPFCKRRKAIDGENDLATLRPDIAKEWDKEKNKELVPNNFLVGSGKKVWWKCPKGHSYQAMILSRTKDGRGCPFCSKQKVIKGKNDLASLRPDIAKEWDTEKNKALVPNNFLVGSGKKVWWKCQEGHSYQACIAGRTGKRANGCPYCSGRRAIRGKNDLQTLRPDIAKEWDVEKNRGILLMDVPVGSSKKVWWKCQEGHSYQACIVGRTGKRASGCPYCSGRRAIRGKNDLQTLRPDIAKEWDVEKNKGKSVIDVPVGSSKRAWWKCQEGHSYQAVIGNRTRKTGSGCPYCSGRKVIVGTTDLATVRPDIAKDWNIDKNGSIKASEVSVGSERSVWWKCASCGYEWYQKICNNVKGAGCPRCK